MPELESGQPGLQSSPHPVVTDKITLAGKHLGGSRLFGRIRPRAQLSIARRAERESQVLFTLQGIDAAGVEPATSWARTRHSAKLSYASSDGGGPRLSHGNARCTSHVAAPVEGWCGRASNLACRPEQNRSADSRFAPCRRW